MRMRYGVEELEEMLTKANQELNHVVAVSAGYKSMWKSERNRRVMRASLSPSQSPSPGDYGTPIGIVGCYRGGIDTPGGMQVSPPES